MELSEEISVRKFLEFTPEKKEELCFTLLELCDIVNDLPKKSLKKTLEITLAALKYKNEQTLDSKNAASKDSDKGLERVVNENDKLKEMLHKMQNENINLKEKIKSLEDEIFQMQKRLDEARQPSENSDKDSSDPLSKLDKQEDLLRNINMKNKHIRRLIRDIEAIQNQNIDFSKTILKHENEVQQYKAELNAAQEAQIDLKEELNSFEENNKALKMEIVRLEGNVTYLEDEREKAETELQQLTLKFEEKTHNWRQQLQVKDLELQQLRTNSNTTITSTVDKDGTETTSQIEKDFDKVMLALEKRDITIEELKSKIKLMADEMLNSTEVMNKLNNEQDVVNLRRCYSNTCCKLTEQNLQAANERSLELAQILSNCEEENRLQAKRLQQALSTLEAYQRGEDGLAKVLRKCSAVERKLMARDKQIRAQVQELNDLQEVTKQNQVLRKRLGISEDELITTKHLSAKERNKEKIIEQLTLKLRASEEKRLQLKLNLTQLRQDMLVKRAEHKLTVAIDDVTQSQPVVKKFKKDVSEIGEVEDSSSLVEVIDVQVHRNTEMELPHKYHELLMENQTLRNGMHEILEKLQSCSEAFSFISIDKQLLENLLIALQPQGMSTNSETKKLQKQVRELQKREVALELLLNETADNLLMHDNSENSIQEVRTSQVSNKSTETLVILPDFASSTRPSSPSLNMNKSIVLPVIDDIPPIVVECDTPNYKAQYEELKLQISKSESEIQAYCAQLIEEAAVKDMELKKQKRSFTYLKEELDKTLSLFKEKELQNIIIVAELKQNVNEKKVLHIQLENAFEQYKQNYKYHNDEFKELEKAQQANQAQLGKVVHLVLLGEISKEFRIKDLCVDYGIIEEDLPMKYITAQEYTEKNKNYSEAVEKYEDLRRQLTQVEGLLQIAQDQIKSQQKLIHELTDNHINLRHLVADLQSANEEKFLLAKMQRELDACK